MKTLAQTMQELKNIVDGQSKEGTPLTEIAPRKKAMATPYRKALNEQFHKILLKETSESKR